MISVAVLPMRTLVDDPLPENEVEVETMRGHGPGGQNRHNNETAVRVRHTPTGITSYVQNERSQHQNKMEAMRILTARVNDLRRGEANKAYADFRKTNLGTGKRGSKIRTYNFIDSRVTDHQLGRKTSRIDAVMKGSFELLIK
jgi:peptide chain release factor 1